jgi:hypothetical protein
MKLFLCLYLLIISNAFSQNQVPTKHPRVAEVEELLRDEASRYFERRFPGSAFFTRVEVTPLRRDAITGKRSESLPYFDYESEEGLDEWDDPKTPLAFLRHRVTKIAIEISIPEKFSDDRIAGLKEELSIYLRLLPYRDDIKIEKKIKDKTEFLVPDYAYVIIAGVFLATLVAALVIRNGLKKSGMAATSSGSAASQTASSPVSAPSAPARAATPKGGSSTEVSGDVTFHDPLKAMDIIHSKIKQIEASNTFPTLSDLMTLTELSHKSPGKLSAVVGELSEEYRRQLFPLGSGKDWLESFSRSGRLDHDCLNILDQMGRERSFVKKDRGWEDLLIQVWRMEEKAVPFFKRIPQDHGFLILDSLPKSVSLPIAKKSYPGGWGRLLEKTKGDVVLSASVLSDYLEQSRAIEPLLDWSILEDYRKDRELLNYLDKVTIDDEKELYDTLNDDSFILKVRPPFYKVFELEAQEWSAFLRRFPIERWALSVVNSSRNYMKKVNEGLDEKQRIVFSQHLRRLDGDLDVLEQSSVRQEIAKAYAAEVGVKKPAEQVVEPAKEELNEKSA